MNVRSPDGVSGVAGSYRELGGIAYALGVPFTGAPEIRLARDGFEIIIGLNIHSGEVVGVDFIIRRDPIQSGGVWPEMELRRETPGDIEAKRSGMNIEVQTGDPTFDGFVYVESRFDQSVLGPALASPDLRRVIGELIATYGPITVTPVSLTVATSSLRKTLLEVSVFMPLFQRMVRLAHLLRPLPQGAQTRVNERGFFVLVFSIINFFGCWLTFIPLSDGYAKPVSILTNFIFLGLGALLMAIAIPLFRIYVRGHSRSRFYFRGAAFTLFIGLPVLTMNALLLLNAALDPSPPERITGKIVLSRDTIDDHAHVIEATIDWTEKTAPIVRREQRDLKGPSASAKVGDSVEAVRHAGLFGRAWYSVQPRLVVSRE